MALPDINNRQDLKDWLGIQSRETVLILATRAVLRAMPLRRDMVVESASLKRPEIGFDLWAWRNIAVPWMVSRYSTHGIFNKPFGMAIFRTASYGDSWRSARSIFLLTRSLFTVSPAGPASQIIEISNINTLKHAFGLDRSKAVKQISDACYRDMRFCESEGDLQKLLQQPLWIEDTPDWVNTKWDKTRSNYRRRLKTWQVWIDWYEAILEGRPTPGGEELDVYRVTLDNEDDWAKGPAHVNGLIKKKQDEIEDQIVAEIAEKFEEIVARGKLSPPPTSQDLLEAEQIFAEFRQKPKLALQNGKLAFDFQEGSGSIDPLASRQHPEVLKQVKRLDERVARLSNTHKELAEDTKDLLSLVDRSFEDVAASDVEIWNLSLSLAEHLQSDTDARLSNDPRVPSLDSDDRRALEATVNRLAPWVRLLPNSTRLDDEYRGYRASQVSLDAAMNLFEKQQDQIKFLDESTKELLLLALRTSLGSTEQAVKASGLAVDGAKAIAKEGTLVSRRGFFSWMRKGVAFTGASAAAGASKKIGEEVVVQTGAAASIGKWAKDSKDWILKLFDDVPPDVKAAIKNLLESDDMIDL